MQNHLPRYKVIPHLTDTAGFFDYYVPYTNQSKIPINDSIKEFYNFSIFDFKRPAKIETGSKPGPSIFTSHLLEPSPYGPKPIQKQSTDWIVILVILCLIIIAWVQTNYSKRLTQIIRSVALPYFVNQLEREGNLYNERITLGLGFVFLTSVSMLIYQFFQFYGLIDFNISGFNLYLLIFGGVVGYLIIKTLLIQFTGILFKTADQAHSYRLNTLIFNHTIGLFLFPVLLFSQYWQAQPFIWIALGIASTLLIYRFLRSISIGLSNTKFPVFYLILYLCTLEILPLLLLIKVIRQI
jgi:hypothetical protein